MENDSSGPDVFISYRHADTREIVDRIYDYLGVELGENRVFRDVEGIGQGQLIRDRVDAALKTCKVMLVVIGKGWAEASDRDSPVKIMQ